MEKKVKLHCFLLPRAFSYFAVVLLFAANGMQQEPTNKRPKIGLALSSGGARGLAHIGVLKALEEERIPIDMIAGSSMGGIVGGLYACGYSATKIEKIVKGIDWSKVFEGRPEPRSIPVSRKYAEAQSILRVRFDGWRPRLPSGLLSAHRIQQILFELTAPANFDAKGDFDNLKIPFRAIAVDLATGEPVALSNGDLALAMRASMSIPFLFPPVKIGKRILVDGGVLNNLPTDVVRAMGADIILAADASSSKLQQKIKLNNLITITSQTMKIWTATSNNYYRQIADVLVEPDIGEHLAVNYTGIDSLIKAGYLATMEKMADIKRIVGQKRKSKKPDNEAKINDNLSGATVAKISIQENKSVRREYVLEEFPLRVGDLFNMRKARQGVENLYATGLFGNVWLEVKNAARSRAELDVHIEEISHNTLEFGANYRSEEGVSGFIRLKNNNLCGRGEWLSLTLRKGGTKHRLQLQMQNDRLFATDFSFYSNTYFEKERPRLYFRGKATGKLRVDKWGAEAAIGVTMKKTGLVSAGLRVENAAIKDSPVSAAADLRTRSIFVRTILDDLDDFYFPTSGYQFSLSWESALHLLNSNTRFSKFTARLRSYFTIQSRYTFSTVFFGGLSKGNLPVYKKFRLGGPDTLPGFHRDEFWANEILFLRASYQLKVVTNFYLRAYFNFGGLWENLNAMHLRDLRLAFGGGIGIATPMGPILLDYGRAYEGNHHLYVTIGYIF